MSTNSIKVRAINIKKQTRYTDWMISGEPGLKIDMFTYKGQIIKKAFVRKVHYKLTDFVFWEKNDKHIPSVEDIRESRGSAKDFFCPDNDLEVAYDFFKKYNIAQFYYLALFLKLKIIINNDSKIEPLEMELNYDDNSYSSLINYISEKCQCDPKLIKVFIKNEKLDEVDQNQDMKKYEETGLVAYTFPIEVQFNYLGHEKNLLLKYDRPLKSYISEIKKLKFNFKSQKLVFKHNNEVISDSLSIHQILRKCDRPVIIDIEDYQLNKIDVEVPFNGKNIKFKFDYDIDDTIEKLLTIIQNYFEAEDSFSITNNGKGVSPKSKVSKYAKESHLLLNSKKKIVFKRTFMIRNEPKIMVINPNKRINNIIKQIAKENYTDPSIIQLSFNQEILSPDLYFSYFFIPPKQNIIVSIEDFKQHIRIKVLDEGQKEFKIGYSPKMKISSIKNFKHFQDIIPSEFQNGTFFAVEKEKRFIILDENKTFETYEIKANDVITACKSNCHIFIYKNESYPLYIKMHINEIKSKIEEYYHLKPNKYFIANKGQLYNEELENMSKYPNGTIFEIKDVQKLHFSINYEGEYKMVMANNKQAKDLIQELKKKNDKVDPQKIQLFNEFDKPVNSDAYLFSSFSEDGESYIYKIQAKNLEQFSFISSGGKIFNEYLYPSLRIKDVKKELQNRNKKVNEQSYFICKGRILDDNDLLSSVSNEDDDPISIEQEKPEQITITLKLKDDEKPLSQIAMVKGSTAYDLRCLAAQPTQIKDLDQICLIANDNQLNDDDELIDDMEVIVDIFQAGQNEQAKDEVLYQTAKQLKKYQASDHLSKTIQVVEEAPNQSMSSSDSFLDDYEDEVEDPFEKGNGTYEASKDSPDTEYIFKFKEPNEELFKLQLPKDVTVKDVKDKISERNNVAFEDITIFVGNQRLADFNILTALVIPKTVHYFTVKIVDLKVSIICTRIK